MLLRFGLVVGLCLVLVLGEEEEIIKCQGGTCVKLHLCPNGELNTDGSNIIDIRFNPDNDCEDYLLKCCPDPEEDDDDVDEPPSSGPIVQPDTVTKPSSGQGADPVPGTVPSQPSSNQQGTGPTIPGIKDSLKPGGGVGSVVNGNNNKGCSGSGFCPPSGGVGNDEQAQLIGGQVFLNPGQVAANQVKENGNVPSVQGGGPQVPNAGTNKKPGGDIAPGDAGIILGQPNNRPGNTGSSSTPSDAGSKQPVQQGTGSGKNGSTMPPATNTGTTQPSQTGTGLGNLGSSSLPATNTNVKQPSQTGPGAGNNGSSPQPTNNVKQPGQTGPGAGNNGSPIPPATNTGTTQPGQTGPGFGNIGSSSLPTTNTDVKQPGQTGPGAGNNGSSPQPANNVKQPGQTGPGAGNNGSAPQPANNVKQPGQTGPGAGNNGSPIPPATNTGTTQPGQTGPGSGNIGSTSLPATNTDVKQPGQTGPGAGNNGSAPQPANNVKQPGQTGNGSGNTGSSSSPGIKTTPTATNGVIQPGKPSTGLPITGSTSSPATNSIDQQPGSQGAGPVRSPGTKGDGTNKKGPVGTTERPITVPQKCGVRNVDGVGFRITGDNDGESEYGEFPWMVAILKEEKALDQVINVYQCGGSLIHPSVVLTAAHCVQNRQPAEMKVRLGEWDTQTKNEIYDYQDRNVVEIVSHAEFYKGGLFNDVALLFLDKPAELMDTVSTICLPPADYNFDLSRCFASGWGKDVFGKQGTYQVILKKIELPIMERDRCQKALRTTRLGNRFKLHKSFICAGGEKGRDTCKGDGGSPLVCPIPGTVNQYYQAGMVAWGIGCGENGIPGVYVNVPLFRGWIDEHLTQRNIPHSYYLPA